MGDQDRIPLYNINIRQTSDGNIEIHQSEGLLVEKTNIRTLRHMIRRIIMTHLALLAQSHGKP